VVDEGETLSVVAGSVQWCREKPQGYLADMSVAAAVCIVAYNWL
jgi:hypothetical protein